jgi:hypothetical protein
VFDAANYFVADRRVLIVLLVVVLLVTALWLRRR